MNRITEILKIKYPVIQGPMSWITSAEMVAAISNAGGLGTLGPNAGYNTVTPDPVETAARLREQIKKTRELTDKPFAVNYLLTSTETKKDPYSEEVLKVLIEEKAKNLVVVDFDEINFFEISRLKELGFTIIFRGQTPTAKQAKDAERAGVDILVATGYDEGGTLPTKQVGTMAITKILAEAVNIPVVAAGGIVDRRTANAAMAVGAEGVFVGTRFIVSQECRASERTKQDIIAAKVDDLILVPTDISYWRVTPHKLAKQLNAELNSGGDRDELIEKMKTGGGIKSGMLEGDLENGTVVVSNAINTITSVMTCEEIVNDLMADF